MNEAVIVSVARTPIGKAFRGAFNDTEAPVLGGHAIRADFRRMGVIELKAKDGRIAADNLNAPGKFPSE